MNLRAGVVNRAKRTEWSLVSGSNSSKRIHISAHRARVHPWLTSCVSWKCFIFWFAPVSISLLLLSGVIAKSPKILFPCPIMLLCLMYRQRSFWKYKTRSMLFFFAGAVISVCRGSMLPSPRSSEYCWKATGLFLSRREIYESRGRQASAWLAASESGNHLAQTENLQRPRPTNQSTTKANSWWRTSQGQTPSAPRGYRLWWIRNLSRPRS